MFFSCCKTALSLKVLQSDLSGVYCSRTSEMTGGFVGGVVTTTTGAIVDDGVLIGAGVVGGGVIMTGVFVGGVVTMTTGAIVVGFDCGIGVGSICGELFGSTQ